MFEILPENSRLIAEFMGGERGDVYEITLPPGYHLWKVRGSIDKLKFHKDWDWLDPAIGKMIKLSPGDDWTHPFVGATIDQVFEVVVDFIKKHNLKK